jgi:hypothetical protein
MFNVQSQTRVGRGLCISWERMMRILRHLEPLNLEPAADGALTF